MKKYFTLLLLIPCFCWGQGVPANWQYIQEPSKLFMQYGGSQKQDTVKVLMLVCDTSENMSYGRRRKIQDGIYQKEQRMVEGVWWQFGYEVWGSVVSDYTLLNVDRYGNIEPTMYLDQNKKPLPKSIIVWMSKEIK